MYEARKFTAGTTDVSQNAGTIFREFIRPTQMHEKRHEVRLLCNIVPVLLNREDPWIPIGKYNIGCISEVIQWYYYRYYLKQY